MKKYYISLVITILFTVAGFICAISIPEGARALESKEHLEGAIICWGCAIIAYIYNIKKA